MTQEQDAGQNFDQSEMRQLSFEVSPQVTEGIRRIQEETGVGPTHILLQGIALALELDRIEVTGSGASFLRTPSGDTPVMLFDTDPIDTGPKVGYTRLGMTWHTDLLAHFQEVANRRHTTVEDLMHGFMRKTVELYDATGRPDTHLIFRESNRINQVRLFRPAK